MLLHLYPGLTRKKFERLTRTEWFRVRDWADKWMEARANG